MREQFVEVGNGYSVGGGSVFGVMVGCVVFGGGKCLSGKGGVILHGGGSGNGKGGVGQCQERRSNNGGIGGVFIGGKSGCGRRR